MRGPRVGGDGVKIRPTRREEDPLKRWKDPKNPIKAANPLQTLQTDHVRNEKNKEKTWFIAAWLPRSPLL